MSGRRRVNIVAVVAVPQLRHRRAVGSGSPRALFYYFRYRPGRWPPSAGHTRPLWVWICFRSLLFACQPPVGVAGVAISV